FGRLIRGLDDYGVVAILDTRLITSSYGRTIVSSLPETNTVHSIEDVKVFFDSIPAPPHQRGLRIFTVSNREKKGTGKTGRDNGIFRVVALGNSNDPSVIPELIAFTRSNDGNERRLAASAIRKLARFKPEIYKAIEALEGLLGDEKPQVRQYAMKALAKIGKVNPERLKSIVENPEEKGYNLSLARRLMMRVKVE
ncbi:MAG: HEAT repeat domain-containing protein, partial [Deltaproteobacteria bacterium]|nr:HEAT repeat domain-containing protein [Deltaproteobacteria bacterium]